MSKNDQVVTVSAHIRYRYIMTKEIVIVLDEFEQDIEDNFEKYKPLKNREQEMAMIVQAAKLYVQNKKSQELL